MSNQQFQLILTQIQHTLTEQRTPADDRLLLAGLQVRNALTLLEQPQYAAGGVVADDAPHRKYQEGRDMDSDLTDIRGGTLPLIVRLTDTQLAEIEAERWGE